MSLRAWSQLFSMIQNQFVCKMVTNKFITDEDHDSDKFHLSDAFLFQNV